MSEKLVCPICGAPTRTYMGNARKDRLCGKHADQLKAGEIIQCDECGEWHNANETCECKTKFIYTELPKTGFNECIICKDETYGHAFCLGCWKNHEDDELLDILNKEISKPIEKENPKNKTLNNEEIKNAISSKNEKPEFNEKIVIDENNKSKCITCGRQTDGLLFCPSCYMKYKDKELLFKITGCKNIELLDADYEGRYTCKDGHVVKSKSERDIDNYLFEKQILHAYEKEIAYGATEKETLHPDFFLQNYLGEGNHVYIEHWGYNENNIQYTKTKKFKMPIYEKLCKNQEMTLICTYEKTDAGKIDSALDRKLKKEFITIHEINDENKSN